MISNTPEKTPLILDKIATLTAIRDTEVFEFSFIKILAEMIKVSDIFIYKYNSSNQPYRLLHFSANNQSISIETKNFKIPNEISLAQEWFQSTHQVYKKNHELIIYPIIGLNGIAGYLALKLLQPLTNTEAHLITGLLSISHNFYSLLEENQKDKLTGLLNRKTFDDNISKIQNILNTSKLKDHFSGEEKRALQNTKEFWLAILDIDHFKRINDSFGHIYGDEVLLLLSQLMQQSFRHKDLLFRFGGEEFVAIMKVENRETAQLILERFRTAVESFNFPQVGQVTISTGATQIMEQHAIASEIVGRADQALYHAKETGRNRLYFYEKLISEGLLEEQIEEGDIELF